MAPTQAGKDAEIFDDIENDFKDDFASAEKMIAEAVKPSNPPIQKKPAERQAQAPSSAAPLFPAPQSGQPYASAPAPEQKIPAFISLDRYKDTRRSLKEMRVISSVMRKTIGDLKKNRDDGNSLLNSSVDGLERMEDCVDKIKNVLKIPATGA